MEIGDSPTAGGTLAQESAHPRRTFRDSLIASAIGYAVGTILIAFAYFSPMGTLFGVLLSPWLVAFFHIAGSMIGWLVFLLPVSVTHRSEGRTDHLLPMCSVAALMALTITGVETMPLTSYQARIFSMRELYIAAGVLESCAATTVLILLRRRMGHSIRRDSLNF